MSLWLVSDNGGRIMLVVNLFGAPGAGKSTGAAYIFSRLKMLGINAELVTEFAKDKVWENNQEALSNQTYMFGKQCYRISRCADKVDVIVTDSPLLLSALYNNSELLGESFNDLVAKVSKSYDSVNYFIERVKPYNQAGRLQNERESDLLVGKLKGLLTKYNIDYKTQKGNTAGYDNIVYDVLKETLNNDT